MFLTCIHPCPAGDAKSTPSTRNWPVGWWECGEILEFCQKFFSHHEGNDTISSCWLVDGCLHLLRWSEERKSRL